jgi:RNA polymerase sigma-70 factor (ECF subfamily)
VTIRELFEDYESQLHRYAERLARDPDRAGDLVQETFIRALGHLPLLENLERYQRRAWLYRTLKNRFIDEERARQRQQLAYEQLAQEPSLDDLPAPSVIVATLIGQAPERYQEVLYERYILGKTSQQIGDELGVPPATIRSRLFLARKWLAAHRARLSLARG